MKMRALVCCAILILGSCDTAPPEKPQEWLVTVSGAKADLNLTESSAGVFEGTIVIHDPAVPVAFSEKPAREVGTLQTVPFVVEIWDYANRDSPPNAFLSGALKEEKGDDDTYTNEELVIDIVEKPTYDAANDRLTLKVKVLGSLNAALPKATLQGVNLVIDSWGRCITMAIRCPTLPYVVGQVVAALGTGGYTLLLSTLAIAKCARDIEGCFTQ